MPKNERLHYLRLVGADVSSWEVNKFEEKNQRDKERKEARDAKNSLANIEVSNTTNGTSDSIISPNT